MAVYEASAELPPVYAASIINGTFGWPSTYEVLVELPNSSRVLQRRYRDFERLHEGLDAADASATSSLPPLPRKGVVSMLQRDFRDSRQEGLSSYLAAVTAAFPALESEPLALFLEAVPEEREAIRVAWSRRTQSDRGPAAAVQALSFTAPADVSPTAAASPAAAPAEASSAPRSDMDEIRELRRRRWLSQGANASTPDAGAPSSQSAPPAAPTAAASSRAPAPALSASAVPAAAASPEPLPTLTRISILPLQNMPPEFDGERERMQILREPLRRHRSQAIPIDVGTVFDSSGFRFAVIKCDPVSKGVPDANTQYFCYGPPLPRLERVQMTGLVRHDSTQEDVFTHYIAPELRTIFADSSRCQIVRADDTPRFSGVPFHIQAIDPNLQGWGIIDRDTEIFASRDGVSEFDRIHVVPFSDTLPSAYNYDVFQDYVKPFFASHLIDRFQQGDSFYHNGVHFKVHACEPSGPCRVGNSTVIFCEGRLHPTAAELLTPEQARHLAIFPAGLQMLLLQTNHFGNGDIADRIMEAQSQHARARQHGLSTSTLENIAGEEVWSEELRQRFNVEQTECIICICDFEDGDRVRCLPCNHVFHSNCIDEWLGRDAHCPLCRHGLQTRRRGWGR